jgi:hypothetical protein
LAYYCINCINYSAKYVPFTLSSKYFETVSRITPLYTDFFSDCQFRKIRLFWPVKYTRVMWSSKYFQIL